MSESRGRAWICGLMLLAACGGESEPSELPGPVARLEAASPARQIVPPGEDAAPLVVRAVDSAGRSVPDVAVTFQSSPGHGVLVDGNQAGGSITVRTGSDGRAAAAWRSNHTEVPDSAEVTATAAGLPDVTFALFVGYEEPSPGPSLAAASTFSCYQASTTEVSCWGSMQSGWQSPTEITTVSAFGTTACSAGARQRVCTGDNTAGQYGNGSTDGTGSQQTVIDDGHDFVSLAIGGSHSCGVDRFARLYCWSVASSATLLPGSSRSGLPELLGHGYTQVASGHDFMCALHVSGEIRCRGDNARGQLGGAVSDGFSRSEGPYIQVTAAHQHACGLLQGGSAHCWGDNASGQLGDGSTSDRQVPTVVAGGHGFTSLTAGRTHTCALQADGRAFCWGSNEQGELGNDSFDDSASPVAVAGPLEFAALAAGDGHTCGILTDGGRACWGATGAGQVPLGFGSRVPVEFPGPAFDALWSGYPGHCARSGPDIYCWGGWDGSTELRPVPQAAGMQSFTWNRKINCGIFADGIAGCWGDNEYGALGNGTVGGITSSPTAVLTSERFSKLAVGDRHACGLALTGRVWCWGDNTYGQLGIGAEEPGSATPREVFGGGTYTDVTAGDAYSCARDTQSRVHCWGGNVGGRLGDGSETNRPLPTPVYGTLQFGSVDAFGAHTCALTLTNVAYCWGISPNSGTLGYEPQPNPCGAFLGTCSWTPGQVLAPAHFLILAGDWWGTCGIATDGKPWCWGGIYARQPSAVRTDLAFESLNVHSDPFSGETFCGRAIAGGVHCWGQIYAWTSIYETSRGMPRPFAF